MVWETIEIIFGIFVTIIGGTAAVIRAVSNMNQTNISITFMNHEERNKYIFTQQVTLFLATFVLLIVIVLSLNGGAAVYDLIATEITTQQVEDASEQDKSNEEQTSINGQEILTDESAQNDNGETDILEYEVIKGSRLIDIIIPVVVIGIPLVFGIIATFISYKREKDDFIWRNEVKWTRYLYIVVITFAFIFSIEFLAILGIGTKSKDFIPVFVFFSLIASFISCLMLKTFVREFSTEMAYTKVHYEDKVYYAFEKIDDKIVVGDALFMNECSELYLLGEDDLKNGYFTMAITDDDIKLKKDDVTFDGGDENAEMRALKAIAYDFKEKNKKRIPDNSIVSIKKEHDDLKYKIGDEQEVITKIKHANKYKGVITIVD